SMPDDALNDGLRADADLLDAWPWLRRDAAHGDPQCGRAGGEPLRRHLHPTDALLCRGGVEVETRPAACPINRSERVSYTINMKAEKLRTIHCAIICAVVIATSC